MMRRNQHGKRFTTVHVVRSLFWICITVRKYVAYVYPPCPYISGIIYLVMMSIDRWVVGCVPVLAAMHVAPITNDALNTQQAAGTTAPQAPSHAPSGARSFVSRARARSRLLALVVSEARLRGGSSAKYVYLSSTYCNQLTVRNTPV